MHIKITCGSDSSISCSVCAFDTLVKGQHLLGEWMWCRFIVLHLSAQSTGYSNYSQGLTLVLGWHDAYHVHCDLVYWLVRSGCSKSHTWTKVRTLGFLEWWLSWLCLVGPAHTNIHIWYQDSLLPLYNVVIFFTA